MNRYFDLYLTAGHSVPVVINANQYDSSETWIFTLYTEDDQLYTPASGSIVGLKSDGHTIANAGTVNNDGQVVIQETVQITAAKGINVFELVLDGNHGTANFVVLVEPRPGDNVTPSDSELTLMEQAIAAAGSIEAVSVLQDTVNSVASRMDEFIADHAGLANETVLWTGNLFKTYQSPSVTPTGGMATLSQKVTDFDYIGVYTTMNTLGNDQTADVHWYNADEFADKPTMVTCGTTKAYSGTTDWVAIPYITLLMDSDEVTCTVFNAGLVSWNGQAESNATSQTSEGSTNYQGSVVKIVGIKNTQNDTEVIDARVGADGTTYNTLEARLNAENLALKSAIQQMGGGIPTAVRQAIATLFNSALYDVTGLTDEKAVINSWASTITAITLNQSTISISGQGTYQLTATTTPSGGTVTWSSSNTAVATVSNNGLVTSVGNGTATITASCGGLTATCTATVSGFATLSSISAVFTQGDNVIYDTDSLDDLKQYLVVTATYSNSQTAVLSDDAYTLSGSLTTGTSTITASYQSKSDTFNVTVTAFWDIDWEYTDGVPTDYGFTISSTNGTYTMTDDGYKVKTKANNTDANCRPTIDFGPTSGTLEATLRWAIIPPNSMGTTIGGVGWGISIYGSAIVFNYDALGNNQNAVTVFQNVQTNTDYTIRCEYTPTIAKVYVNEELVYTHTGTRTNTRTRYMVNLVNKGGIEHYIKAMRCHAES